MKLRATSTDCLRQIWQNRQPSTEPVRLGALVRAFVAAEGLNHPSPLINLRGIWEELVGPELSRHSRLEGFRRGTLRVVVDSAVHLAELQNLVRAGLAEQIAARFDRRWVSTVRLRLGHQNPGRGRDTNQWA